MEEFLLNALMLLALILLTFMGLLVCCLLTYEFIKEIKKDMKDKRFKNGE